METYVLQQSDICIVGSQKYLWTSYEIFVLYYNLGI